MSSSEHDHGTGRWPGVVPLAIIVGLLAAGVTWFALAADHSADSPAAHSPSHAGSCDGVSAHVSIDDFDGMTASDTSLEAIRVFADRLGGDGDSVAQDARQIHHAGRLTTYEQGDDVYFVRDTPDGYLVEEAELCDGPSA